MKLKNNLILFCASGLAFFFPSQKTFSQQDVYDSLNVNGIWRTYNVHLPTGYNPANIYPLVLGFHGGQQAATSAQGWTVFAYQSELSQKADNSGFIMVYPEGLVYNQNRSWNAGNCCPPAMNQNYDDVGFVDELLNRLFADYPVDTTRVYATGSSNGGMLCYRLACEMGHRIAAIAPNACSHMYSPCNPTRKMPVISFHSKADPIVFYEGGPGGSPLLAGINFPSQDSNLNLWGNLNGCENRDTVVNGNGTNYDYIRLNACDCQVEIHHYATTDGSHSWPGGNPNNNPVSSQISATDLLWSFFQQYSLSCETSKIQETAFHQLRVFPNPASDQLSVVGLPESFTGELSIINSIGKTVWQGPFSTSITIEKLPKGWYIMKAENADQRYIARFVKLN